MRRGLISLRQPRISQKGLGMCSHESDINGPVRIVDVKHQPEIIALDVEHHPITFGNAGTRLPGSNVGRCSPVF